MMQRRHFNTLGATGLGVLALPAGLLPRAAHAAASVGQPAPDFTLSDTAGKPVKLSQFKGKLVVLEWNNPGCPFVRKHYQGNMQALQKEATGQGAVWLAINSTRDDSGDYMTPAQLGRWMTEQKASPTATLPRNTRGSGPLMSRTYCTGAVAEAGRGGSTALPRARGLAPATGRGFTGPWAMRSRSTVPAPRNRFTRASMSSD